MPLNINGPEAGKLSAAIEKAYPTIAGLQLALDATLSFNLQNAAGFGAQYPEIRFNLIQHFNSRYQIDKLVSALLQDRQDVAPLVEFAWKHKISYSPPMAEADLTSATGGLERMLDPVRGFTDFGQLLFRAGQIANAVCQITVPLTAGNLYGTGFLIAKDCVLTNWHVVEKVSDANRQAVRLMFDFRSERNGSTNFTATQYSLKDHTSSWLVAKAPYHANDTVAKPIPERVASNTPTDYLDFAVLRLSEPAGEKQIHGQQRGWLSLTDAVDDPAMYEVGVSEMFIVQHPYDKATKKVLPQQLDWNKPAIKGVNANATRVLYSVNTEPGSSGSPCFNGKLQLIALHHSGGKDWPASSDFLYNQGIPIGLIRQALKPLIDAGEIES